MIHKGKRRKAKQNSQVSCFRPVVVVVVAAGVLVVVVGPIGYSTTLLLPAVSGVAFCRKSYIYISIYLLSSFLYLIYFLVSELPVSFCVPPYCARTRTDTL